MDDGLNTVLLRGTVAEVKARTFLLAVGTRTFELHLDGLSGQDVQAGDTVSCRGEMRGLAAVWFLSMNVRRE